MYMGDSRSNRLSAVEEMSTIEGPSTVTDDFSSRSPNAQFLVPIFVVESIGLMAGVIKEESRWVLVVQ